MTNTDRIERIVRNILGVWCRDADPAASIPIADFVRREVAAEKAAKDGAYAERNRLVAALSKCFPSWLARHPDSDATWENDWRWIVFVQLPTGQASWHIHDSERHWFDHLPVGDNSWDGHTNDEKYARVAALAPRAEVQP